MSQRLNPVDHGSPSFDDRDDDVRLPGFAEARSLKRELLEELRTRREEGTPARPEDLLPRWPTDPKSDADVASLLFEDFHQRRLHGEEPSVAEYEQRFPEHRDSLANLFHHHAVLRSVGRMSGSTTATLALPTVGDELFGFRLRQELGRGAFARVFLAEQANLAGRPVVLKVSAIVGDEPQTLAQLQHTHIVPIYSVHDETRAGLRAVCMPYFGGASLSHILQSIREEVDRPTQGEELVRALAAVGGPAARQGDKETRRQGDKENPPVSLSPCLLVSLSYIQATAWIVARLAEALQHAHDRGVLHRDIKPSNILLGADGQPMLLDFNLAQNLHGDQAQAAATLGGTVAYMAPEHLRALAARDPALARLVNRRADIYSLGMVLYEMLIGHSPFDQSASYTPLPALIEAMAVERSKTVPSLRQRRPDVPWSLESIARKCLEPDAEQRYQRAEHLAEDLRRFLDDRPLAHAPELSRAEQVSKWLRRHPRFASVAPTVAAAALLLAGTATALVAVHQHLTTTSKQLEASHDRDLMREFQEGTVRALCLVNVTNEVRDHLHEGQAVCEKTLALYGIQERDDWQDHPDWQRLPEDERQRLAEDARELLIALAWARHCLAPEDGDVTRQALALLERAEAVRGLPPSPALALERAYYLDKLGDGAGAEAARTAAERIPPASARDHYQLAIGYVRKVDPESHQEGYRRAVAESNEAVRLNPRHYWSWTQRGLCYRELREHALAAIDFSTCVGLWPEFAWGYFNRAASLYQVGKREETLADYTAALARDPAFVVAYRNRGAVYLELARHEQALADFDRAAALGLDDAGLHVKRGAALEGLGRHAEADAAFETALARAAAAEDRVRLRTALAYGYTVLDRRPERAAKAFAEVLLLDANQPQALYGRAMLLMPKEPDRALVLFTRVLAVDPSLTEARRYRAILWARGGRFKQATEDINACLQSEPGSGATLYAAACVMALVAAGGDPLAAKPAADQALQLLQKAFALGYGQDRAAKDDDLAALHQHPEFQRLLPTAVKPFSHGS